MVSSIDLVWMQFKGFKYCFGFDTVKWFQVLQFIVYTHLNSFKYC